LIFFAIRHFIMLPLPLILPYFAIAIDWYGCWHFSFSLIIAISDIRFRRHWCRHAIFIFADYFHGQPAFISWLLPLIAAIDSAFIFAFRRHASHYFIAIIDYKKLPFCQLPAMPPFSLPPFSPLLFLSPPLLLHFALLPLLPWHYYYADAFRHITDYYWLPLLRFSFRHFRRAEFRLILLSIIDSQIIFIIASWCW